MFAHTLFNIRIQLTQLIEKYEKRYLFICI